MQCLTCTARPLFKIHDNDNDIYDLLIVIINALSQPHWVIIDGFCVSISDEEDKEVGKEN